MLVLTIPVGQVVTIGEGPNAIQVKLLGGRGRQISLGFTGPVEVPIRRERAKKKTRGEKPID
jgi:sRNA-binding carbon storage regulator CsrA